LCEKRGSSATESGACLQRRWSYGSSSGQSAELCCTELEPRAPSAVAIRQTRIKTDSDAFASDDLKVNMNHARRIRAEFRAETGFEGVIVAPQCVRFTQSISWEPGNMFAPPSLLA
jgi:hypothetical protein